MIRLLVVVSALLALSWAQERGSRIQACYKEWHEEFPELHLTPKQAAWFHSVGCPNATSPRFDGNVHVLPEAKHVQRRELRLLSKDERKAFYRVLNSLRESYPDPHDQRSEYDILASIHTSTVSPSAHDGPGFNPWHREFIFRFQEFVRKHDPHVVLPYWDPTLDQCLPEPADSVLFSELLVGSADGEVKDGPFASWGVSGKCEKYGTCLTRNADRSKDAAWFLPSRRDIEGLADLETFGSFSRALEAEHAGIHVFTGGHMSSLQCAAHDPLFYLSHVYSDCVWEEFRERQRTIPVLDYPSSRHEDVSPPHDAYARMRPFYPLVNIHGLSMHYTDYYYTCDPVPQHCKDDKDCDSEFLWCDQSGHKPACRSKVRVGGNCEGLPDNACYSENGDRCTCVHDRCQESGGRYNRYDNSHHQQEEPRVQERPREEPRQEPTPRVESAPRNEQPREPEPRRYPAQYPRYDRYDRSYTSYRRKPSDYYDSWRY